MRPNGNNALIDFLKANNVTQDDMIAAGLARPARGWPSDARFLLRPADVSHRRCARPHHRLWRARPRSPTPSPNTSTAAKTRCFPRASISTISPPRARAAIKAGTIIVAEGYMDVIALVRAGFAHAVAPLGTALTDDQLQLLWRTAPEPILAFDGDAAGLKAAHRAAHLALPHLKAGYQSALCLSARRRRPRQLDRQVRRHGDGQAAGCGAAFVGSAVADRNRGP